MKKVYCMYCNFLDNKNECCHKSNVIIKDSWLQQSYKTIKKPSELNALNNCKNYKKWNMDY